MASIIVQGDTSGSITVAAPAISGSNTLTLPATTDTIATLTGNTLTGITLAAGSTSVAPLKFTSGTSLTSAAPGAMEYTTPYSPYFTPFGTSRSVVPAYQYYQLNTAYTGANSTAVQSVFGLSNGFTLAGSTIYEFETVFTLSRTAGTTSHNITIGFGGTATLNNIGFALYGTGGAAATSPLNNVTTTSNDYAFSTNASIQTVTSCVTATTAVLYLIKGTVSVNAAGTFLPQYTLSAAPGGAYSTAIGSYFKITPLAASGANVSIGNVS